MGEQGEDLVERGNIILGVQKRRARLILIFVNCRKQFKSPAKYIWITYIAKRRTSAKGLTCSAELLYLISNIKTGLSYVIRYGILI